MITSKELNKAGAMVQTSDGPGWVDLDRQHGTTVLLDAIVHLTKQRGQPAPLSAVRAYLRPVSTAKAPESEPKEVPMTKESAPEVIAADPLLAKITLPGTPNKIAAALGIHNSGVYQWKKKGHIPDNRREAVEEVIRQIEAGGEVPTAQPAQARAKAKGFHRAPDSRATLEAVAHGLGVQIVPVYVIQGERLVERKGVVW